MTAPERKQQWSEVFHDLVVEWMRPYRRIYAARGFDADDTAQEARLALILAEAYLEDIFTRAKSKFFGNDGLARQEVNAAARTIIRRAVRRKLLGRGKAYPAHEQVTTAAGWDALVKIDKEEADTLRTIEIEEMIAGAEPAVGLYLRMLVDGNGPSDDDPLTKKLRKAAGEYVLKWISQHYRRHES